VLSLLLLGFIVYGTTVEAAHTHGNLSEAKKAVAISSFSDPAKETKTNGPLSGCGECLICRLHQNFSATVLSVPPSIGPSTVGFHIFNLPTVSVHSQTATPQRGRAPPSSL
jgi:hypothetical protein